MTNWWPLAALALGVVLVAFGLYIVLSPNGSEWVVKTSWVEEQPSGPVHLCGGGDITDSQKRAVHDYNEKFAPGSRATYSEASFNADSQHDLYADVAEQGGDECDVIVLDVIYMKEFVAKGLLYDMTPYLELHNRRAGFDDRMMKTTEYDGSLWGVPKQLDVGVLYYRDDQVSRPASWQDVYAQSRPRGGDKPGLRVQVGPYEGLTVLFLELAHAAGAAPIVSDDGKTAQLDQDEVAEALTFLRDAMHHRVIPREEQQDTSNLTMYELGRASFLRGWPFVGAQIDEDADTGKKPLARSARSAAAAHTKIVSLPPWKAGGDSVAVLGGHNLVIPRSAGNPGAALRLIDFMTSDAQVRKDVEEDSQYPVLKDMASEPGVGNRELIDAVQATDDVIPRPSLVRYADVSTIISCRVREIMLGAAADGLREMLGEMNREVQSVLDGGPSKLDGAGCTR